MKLCTILLALGYSEESSNWIQYLMGKGGLIAVQDAGVIEHQLLSNQSQDAVPES